MVQLPGRGGWGKRVTCHQTKITETDKPRVARGLKGLGDNGIVNKPMRVRIGNTENKGEIIPHNIHERPWYPTCAFTRDHTRVR